MFGADINITSDTYTLSTPLLVIIFVCEDVYVFFLFFLQNIVFVGTIKNCLGSNMYPQLMYSSKTRKKKHENTFFSIFFLIFQKSLYIESASFRNGNITVISQFLIEYELQDRYCRISFYFVKSSIV